MNDIIAAHSHCSSHRMEVLASSVCGCFYCLSIFAPVTITDWVDFPLDAPEDQQLDLGTTALCPSCGIDSVIGSNSGYPITTAFLSDMRQHWF
ncbi:MAG TPA: cytoplasmic protein [Rhodoferax sp.]|nr:cytoplasmic protein [Rhodoferax sp.]